MITGNLCESFFMKWRTCAGC